MTILKREIKKYGNYPNGLIVDYFFGLIPFRTVKAVIDHMNENRRNLKNWQCRNTGDRIMDFLILALGTTPMKSYVNYDDKLYKLCSYIIDECQFTAIDLDNIKVLNQYLSNGSIDVYKMLFDFGFKLDYYTFTSVRDHIGSNLSYDAQKRSSKLYRHYMKNTNDVTKEQWDKKWKEEDKRSYPLFFTKKQIKKQFSK